MCALILLEFILYCTTHPEVGVTFILWSLIDQLSSMFHTIPCATRWHQYYIHTYILYPHFSVHDFTSIITNMYLSILLIWYLLFFVDYIQSYVHTYVHYSVTVILVELQAINFINFMILNLKCVIESKTHNSLLIIIPKRAQTILISKSITYPNLPNPGCGPVICG